MPRNNLRLSRIGILAACAALGLCSSCRGALGNGRNSRASGQAAATSPSPQLIPTPGPLFSPPDLKPVSKVDSAFKPCNPYYPLVPGSVAKYTVRNSGRVTANMEVVVNANDDQRKKTTTEISQQVETDRGQMQTTTRKCVCDGGRVEVISQIIDAKVRVGESRAGSARLESKFPSTAVVMDAPASLTPGDSWSYSMVGTVIEEKRPPLTQEPIQLGFQVKGSEDVSVPAGTFKTIHITGTIKGHQLDEYYAPGIGLVKRVSDTGISWELTEYTGLKPLP
ncbi:MAG: hypothetical protein ACREDR_00505 [Blastocatellia bacterium]